MKIKEMKTDDQARVTGYSKGVRFLRDRLVAMGLTRGATFTIKKVAPLGDPVKIELRGFSLSLRKDEADAIEVEVYND